VAWAVDWSAPFWSTERFSPNWPEERIPRAASSASDWAAPRRSWLSMSALVENWLPCAAAIVAASMSSSWPTAKPDWITARRIASRRLERSERLARFIVDSAAL